jgi:FkbM family methyltransferase
VSGTGWESVLRSSLAGGSGEARLVLDIGANLGGFSEMALRFNPKAEIYAFEPIPKLADSIRALSTKYPALHCVQAALGAEPGLREFRVHEHIGSSSLLGPDATYNSLYPAHCAVSELIKVPVIRLDDWAASNGLGARRPIDLVKMDVQGFEGQVIQGGPATLSRTRYLVTEAALFPAYQGGVMLDELCEHLRGLGFEMIWAFEVFAASADLFWRNARLLDTKSAT